ncbi:MAG: hypothetical protein BRD46_00235 [Bacteroidetes bacterium QS_8_68_15]|nr:MAG: hypothetical protein BRD46_00235 [Bacteroidetes bacterium QS_8_68_15]
MANDHRDPDASPKLSDVWSFVLLRGLFEGALLTAVFFGALYRVGPLALLIGSTLLGGSLVELAMAHRLRGHPFRSILIFTGVTGLMIAGLILYNYQFAEAQVTLNLLVVMMGLWVAARGFAALWLGLSIVTGGFDRAVPVGAGLVGLSAGFAALMFFSPEEPAWFVRLLSLYGLGSLVVHLLLARRMRRDRRRLERERSQRQQGQQETRAETSRGA